MIRNLIVCLTLLFSFCAPLYANADIPATAADNLTAKDCVILLHGLARTAKAMSKLENQLRAEGYQVVNESYPSRKDTVENLADAVIAERIQQCAQSWANKGIEAGNIHFVTHSMGGILVRQYLSQHTINGLHRIVMLGPPNQGSQVVDALGHVPGFHFLNGDAGLQLGTDAASIPIMLSAQPPLTAEVGIIAGKRSVNLLLSQFIPGQDDGKVAVDHTKLPVMADFIVMPVTHTFMMKNPKVIQQVISFLNTGRFAHSTKASNNH